MPSCISVCTHSCTFLFAAQNISQVKHRGFLCGDLFWRSFLARKDRLKAAAGHWDMPVVHPLSAQGHRRMACRLIPFLGPESLGTRRRLPHNTLKEPCFGSDAKCSNMPSGPGGYCPVQDSACTGFDQGAYPHCPWRPGSAPQCRRQRAQPPWLCTAARMLLGSPKCKHCHRRSLRCTCSNTPLRTPLL
jgi:hypothetical protein